MNCLKNFKTHTILLASMWLLFLVNVISPVPSALAQNASPKSMKNTVLILKADVKKNLGAYPWEFPHSLTVNSLAVAIDHNLFITLAENISGGMGFQLQKFGSPDLFDAEVIYTNYEVNIAFLQIKKSVDRPILNPIKIIDTALTPLDIADIVDRRTHSEVDFHEASLRSLSLGRSSTSYFILPYHVFDAATLARVTPGAPFLRDNKLAALAVMQKGQKIFALGAPIIDKVLQEYLQGGKKNSFGDLMLYAHPLESPDLRAYLKLRPGGVDQGILVTAIAKKSPFSDKIKAFDVITHVNGTGLNYYGEYEQEHFGLVSLAALLSGYGGNTPVSLDIIRQGSKVHVEAALAPFSSDKFTFSFKPDRTVIDHIILGGAIIQEINEDYLFKFDQNPEKWEENLPVDLAMLLSYQNDPYSHADRTYFVLREILPNIHVKGYERYRNLVIKSINNQGANSFQGLMESLKHPVSMNQKDFLVIEFYDHTFPFIMAQEHLGKANNIVKEKYQINEDAVFFPAISSKVGREIK